MTLGHALQSKSCAQSTKNVEDLPYQLLLDHLEIPQMHLRYRLSYSIEKNFGMRMQCGYWI